MSNVKSSNAPQSAPRWAMNVLWVSLAVFLVAISYILVEAGKYNAPKESIPRSNPQQSESQNTDSVEFKLACIAANGTVDSDCAEVQKFRRIVDSIQKNCGCSREQVGDIIVHTQNVLRSNGRNYPLLKLAEGLETAASDNRSGQSLNTIAATYTTLLLSNQ
jgi:hypothetical protein